MSRMVREVGMLATLALVCATLSAFLHPKRPAWFEVAPDDAKRWSIDLATAFKVASSEDVLWVDVRPTDQFEAGHFPGAISLDLEDWARLMFEQRERLQAALGAPVIVYGDDSSGEKRNEVAQKLRELAGLDPVYLLQGDWIELDGISTTSQP